jgi:hypothetical protein
VPGKPIGGRSPANCGQKLWSALGYKIHIKMFRLVDLLMAYSKRPDLALDLGKANDQLARGSAEGASSGHQSVRSIGGRGRTDLLEDRLSEDEVRQLVAAFTSGTPKWKLAEQYGISLSSVKRLLRARGVRKESGHPRAA